MSELIDRERFSADMRNFQNRVGVWRDEAEDTETRTRADAALATIIETKLILDKQPTIHAQRWHKVEEELPNDGEWAIFTNGKVVSVERFKVDAYNHFFPASEWFDFDDAIAWMPLPEPPKEDA